MADDNNELSIEELRNFIRVGRLPFGITAKTIMEVFEPFGKIQKFYLKRRRSKYSTEFLPNPHVVMSFENSDIIDQIMVARPFYIQDCRLTIRRFMPINPKYPNEAFFTTRKLLIRTSSEQIDAILPDDRAIVEYLTAAGGIIEYFERLDNKTVLVQFDDYDPVDICCLWRPHFINNQPVEVEKCINEEQIRSEIESQQKLNTFPNKHSSNSKPMDIISPTPILSIDDQLKQLELSHNDMTKRLEYEHEQLIASLSNEWKQTAKERIRLQRLTLDYKQEFERITQENRKWKKLYSDSLKEKPIVQAEGEQKLKQACEKTALTKTKYDQLLPNSSK